MTGSHSANAMDPEKKAKFERRFFSLLNMDVSKNRGTPKWMFYNGKPY